MCRALVKSSPNNDEHITLNNGSSLVIVVIRESRNCIVEFGAKFKRKFVATLWTPRNITFNWVGYLTI